MMVSLAVKEYDDDRFTGYPEPSFVVHGADHGPIIQPGKSLEWSGSTYTNYGLTPVRLGVIA